MAAAYSGSSRGKDAKGMDLTFVFCPNLIGLLCLGLLLMFTRFNFYLDRRKLKLFVSAAVCNIVIIVAEVADYMLAQTPFASAFLFRRATSAMAFALSPLVPMLIAYIASNKAMRKWVPLPALLNTIISISSAFTGHLFFVDSYNSYYRGPLFAIMVIISAFYLLLLVYVSFRKLSSAHPTESLFLCGIVGVMVAANLLEMVFSFHFVIWNCCAVLLICYYLFLHIQYFKFDPLTSVFNRNIFNYDVEVLSHKRNVGVLSFDLNGLKTINDTKGHKEGDAYIVAAARLIERCFSGVGSLYRIGGDEFVVLMTNTGKEKICDKIQLFLQMGKETGISVACGFSYMEDAADIAQMLRDADDAMYKNKRDRMMNR